MAERDRFELDLAAALRAYLEEAPTEVRPTELARQFATAYPHRRAALGRWGFGPTPAMAWILLAGLLAALLGGALLVGSQQRRFPAVVPPVGQVFECPPGSNPDKPGPANQARPTGLTIVLPSLAVDRRAGRLVTLTGFDNVETWTFDLCTNTWTRMHPNQEPPPGTGQLVYDVDSDVTIAFDGRRMWAYDLEANTWTEKGPYAPFVHGNQESLRFYDPVSGHVVAWGKGGDDDTLGLELWSYEVETDTWTPIPQGEPPVVGPHYEFFAYDASVDRLVAYANAWGPPDEDGNRLFEAKTWLFDLRTGTWSGTSAVTPLGFTAAMWGAVPAITYDEAAQRTVLLGQGHAAAYDATADRWEILYEGSTVEDQPEACGTRPECRQMPFMVYDPVNERLVVYGDSDGDWLAFDTPTLEWTVLLEPVEGQPAPGYE